MRNAFIKKLTELARQDRRIFLITGDLGFGVLEEFERNFPNQYLNAGVAEQNMTGLATGLALEGKIVFTYSIANFPTLRCLEQLRNDVCYHRANVKAVAIGGGFSYGPLGFSHHATEDLAILRSLPEMTVVAPGDLWEAEEATAALAKIEGPGYLRLDKSAAAPTQRPGERFEIGRGRRVREGTDLTLVAAGGILGAVLKAADRLARQGIECRVVSLHTIKPLDTKILAQAAEETGGIVTVEEHTVLGGLGGAAAEFFLEAGVVPPIFYRIGLRDGFCSLVGSQGYLRKRSGMDEEAIEETVRRRLSEKKKVYLKSARIS
jgi:transketolase